MINSIKKPYESHHGIILHGEMGKIISSFAWNKTPLGPLTQWPSLLKSTVNSVLLSPLPTAILWGAEGILLYNNGYAKVAGARHPSILGQKVLEAWPEADDHIRGYMEKVLQGESLSYSDQKLVLERDNGFKDCWFDISYGPILDNDLIPAGVLAVVIETTQWVVAEQKQKRTEEALQEREAHLGALLTATSDVIYRMNADWSEMYYVEGRNFLADTNEPIKDWVEKYHHHNDQERVMQAIKEAIRTKSIFHLEHQVINKEGELGWTISRAIPILDDNGEIVEWVGAATDVTERRRAEEALQESEERFRIMADAAPNFVWTLGPDGSVTYMNEYGLKFFDTPREKLVSWAPFVHPDDMEPAGKLLQEAYKNRTKYRFEHRIKRADGKYYWVISTANPAILSNGELFGYIGSSVDITERRRAEEAMRESEERFRIMADAAPNMIWALKPDGSMGYANNYFLEYFGISYEELERRTWVPFVHPDDLELAKKTIDDTIRDRSFFKIEHRLLRNDGEYRWFLSQGAPSFYPNGELYGYVGSVIDIHDSKKAAEDLELNIAQLKRINTDLDNFVYTASHDLKAPVLNIEGLLGVLRSRLESEKMEDKTDKLLQLMEKSVDRFKTTILDLTEISKVQKLQEEDIKEVRFPQLVEDVKLSINDQVAASGAIITTDFHQADRIVFSRRNLKSILYNLISNSIKYRDINRPPEVFITTEKEADFTVLSVTDNGLGIKEQYLEKIFLMFKRFNNQVEGSGIGLYIVKRIVENNGGKIEVESEPGKGTIFRVYFRNIKE